MAIVKRAGKLASIQLGAVWGHDTFVKFMIVTRSRTGSNYLVSLLNSHPNLYCEQEVFSKLGNRCVQEVLKKVFSDKPTWIHASGIKVMYYHPIDRNRNQLWDTLSGMKDLQIIHLRRNNILRSILSREIARKSNFWFRGKRDPTIPLPQRKVSLDANELRKCFRLTRIWEARFRKRFQTHQVLDISYEDLISNQEKELKKVVNFLGVDFQPMTSNFQQQNPESIESLVRNFRELKSFFSETRWEGFFDDLPPKT